MQPEQGNKQEDDDNVPWWASRRFLTTVILFLGTAIVHAQRVTLSVTILAMVNNTAAETPEMVYSEVTVDISNITDQGMSYYTHTSGHVHENDPQEAEPCPEDDEMRGSGKAHAGEFVWSKGLQGLLLGAFFWGYLTLQIPGGWLSQRFGAKRTIACGLYPVAVLTLLSPLAARASPYLLLALRIAMGIVQSVMYPSIMTLYSRWSPPWERSRLIGFASAGSQLGNAVTFPVSGLLCEYGFDGGWPSAFYVLGTLGFLWCVVWTLYVHDSPADCPGISKGEKQYIEQSLGRDTQKDKDMPIPWLSILASRPFWAILIAHVCGNFGTYTIFTNIPTYMKEVLHFDIKKNGAFSMLPYLGYWTSIHISGVGADFLIERNILSVVRTRKLFGSTGLFLTAVCLAICGHMTCTQQGAAVFLLTLSLGFIGLQFGGYLVNHGDIAPPFAGTLFGITNTIATFPGILAPYMVGAITVDKTREQWQLVFYIMAGAHLFGGIVYLIFAGGSPQEWAKPRTIVIEVDEPAESMLKNPHRTSVHIESDISISHHSSLLLDDTVPVTI